jgi:hypothetical protein
MTDDELKAFIAQAIAQQQPVKRSFLDKIGEWLSQQGTQRGAIFVIAPVLIHFGIDQETVMQLAMLAYGAHNALTEG